MPFVVVTTPLPQSCDTLVIGGGVVGLSIAYELANRGASVVVVDRQPPGLEASWAGAGILPPGSWYSDHPAVETLAALSGRLNSQWSSDLAAMTGIDNRLSMTGSIHFATDQHHLQSLQAKFNAWAAFGIETNVLNSAQLERLEPRLKVHDQVAAFLVPGETQVDNRQHSAALATACEKLGARLCYPAEVRSVECAGERISAIQTSAGAVHADQVVLAAGAWSGGLAELFGLQIDIRPIRGQMIELGPLPSPLLTRMVHCGDKYLVPRTSSRMLVGSTVEDVGFNKQTVEIQLAELEAFARQALLGLADVPVVDSWAGLRPASGDGLPYIGRAAGVHNAYVATGHFRAGLQLASGTAVALADLMTGNAPPLDLNPFRPDR